MKKNIRIQTSSLAFNYLKWIIPFLIMILIAFGITSFIRDKKLAVSKHITLGENLTQGVNNALRTWIEDQIRIIKNIAEDPRVKKALANPGNPILLKEADSFLEEMHKRHPFYENLPLSVKLPKNKKIRVRTETGIKVITDGQFITDTVEDKTIGKCGSNFSYIKSLYEGKDHYISKVYPSLLRGNPIFVISAPVKYRGRLVGVAVIAPQMSYFTDKFVDSTKVGKTGYMAMTDERSMIIAHPNKKLILNKKSQEHTSAVLKHIAAGETHFKETYDSRTRNYIMSKFDTKGLNIEHGWQIMYSQEENEILEQVYHFMLQLTVFIIILSAILVFSMVFLTRRLISNPLHEGISLSEAISAGNLTENFDDSRNDEIGLLMKAMKTMVGKLKNVMGGIRGSANEIAAASEEFSSSTQSFSRNAQDQAASAEEISATIEQLSAGMDNVNHEIKGQFDNINTVSERIEELDVLIDTMVNNAGETLTSTSDIVKQANIGKDSMDGMNSSMSNITKSYDAMKGTVQIISDISDKINLLSLNAAIEAARAGESGRGFAVVADEISNLAVGTAESIKTIERLFGQNKKEIDSGTEEVKKSIEVIAGIIESINKINLMMNELNDGTEKQKEISRNVTREILEIKEKTENIKYASEEQKNAVQEISNAINEINNLTQANAAGAEEMEASSSNLNNIADNLIRNIEYFRESK